MQQSRFTQDVGLRQAVVESPPSYLFFSNCEFNHCVLQALLPQGHTQYVGMRLLSTLQPIHWWVCGVGVKEASYTNCAIAAFRLPAKI